MSLLAFDLAQYYSQVFGGKPYKINKDNNAPADLPAINLDITNTSLNGDQFSDAGHLLKTKYLGVEIWLPVKFYGLKKLTNEKFSFNELLLPYVTISVNAKKTWIKTPLAERSGTVKEL